MGVKTVAMSSQELDDENSRRSTRGRNPLPPTAGPLFPPLPPKIPKVKNSPKLPTSSKSPSGSRASASKPDNSRSTASAVSPPPDTRSSRSVSSKANIASGSGTSLTPPPPDQEADSDDRLTPEADEAMEELVEGGDWKHYRSRRTIRAFPGSASKTSVKAEPDEEDEDETPRRTRNGRRHAVPNSGENTPSAEAVGSGSDWSAKPRKRRGEEMLLLDDHLLPEEIRRTGTLAARRDKALAPASPKEEDEQEEEEELEVAEEPEPLDDDKLTEEEPLKEEEDAVPEEDEEDAAADEEEDDEGGEDDVTRCVCFTMDSDEMMIQCDNCNVWQHGQCVGIWTDEEAPDEYFCEKCKPELHQPLKKWMKNKRTPIMYIPPTPHDLKRLHYASEKYPPSQSKRWSEPALNTPLPFSPPPRPRKPPSPVRDTSRRGGSRTAAKAAPLPPPRSERHAPSAEPQKRQVSHRRKASIDAQQSPLRESRSPPRFGTEPKRRSTMNSRDAAYEEAVKRALEESRLEALGPDAEELEPLDEAAIEDDPPPVERKNKGKRKREDDEGSVEPHGPNSHGGKPKHPNQYTYRPKPLSASIAPAAPSPIRRGHQGGTPVPVAPPAQHEHGTRRAGALATSAVAQPFTTTTSIHNLHWHLPDHLSLFSDLLSTAAPVPLEVRSPRTMPYLPRNHFLNQRYGPLPEVRDADGKLILPDDQPGREREPITDKTTHLEAPARVKYPQRRMTTADLRKRVRSVLDYINRIQAEEGKRVERAKILGIDAKPLPEKQKRKRRETLPETEAADTGDAIEAEAEKGEKLVNGHALADDDIEMADTEKPPDAQLEADANGELPDSENAVTKAADTDATNLDPNASETPPDPTPAAIETAQEEEEEEEEDEEDEEDEEAHIPRLTTRTGPTAASLLDDLAKEIAAFQETLFAGGFSTPQPPSSATLPTNGDYQPTSGLAKQVALAMGDESDAGSANGVETDPTPAESPLAGLGIGLPLGSEKSNGADANGVELMLETTDEPVDVYREGKVAKVVSSGSSATVKV